MAIGLPFSKSYVGRMRKLIGATPMIVVSNRIVIEREDGAVLLEKRIDFSCHGLIGGAVEDTESMLQSVHREALEETGLEIRNPIPFAYASDPVGDRIVYPGGDVTFSHAMCFLVKEWSGELRAQDGENLGHEWHRPDALPAGTRDAAIKTLGQLKAYHATGFFQLA
jgi:ADP-ribose pyrophosphatase YjhB (NUDIX family)